MKVLATKVTDAYAMEFSELAEKLKVTPSEALRQITQTWIDRARMRDEVLVKTCACGRFFREKLEYLNHLDLEHREKMRKVEVSIMLDQMERLEQMEV